MANIALAGHSLGGLAALLGVEQDKRFKAGIVIDNIVPEALISPTKTPVLLIAAGRKQWTAEERHLWDQLRGPRLAVNLVGAEHLTPTDAVWVMHGAIKTGNMGTQKTVSAVRDYVAAFLDSILRGERGLLFGKSAEYSGVTVTTQNQLLSNEP